MRECPYVRAGKLGVADNVRGKNGNDQRSFAFAGAGAREKLGLAEIVAQP